MDSVTRYPTRPQFTEVIDIGRLAATALTIPFSVISLNATSAEERDEYAFASLVVRAAAGSRIRKRALKAEALRSSAAKGTRDTSAAIASRAVKITRAREKKEVAAELGAEVGIEDAIRTTFSTYSYKELSEMLNAGRVSTQHGGNPFTRSEAVLIATLAVAKLMVGNEE